MAKRKKAKRQKRTSTRRRSVGKTPDIDIMGMALIIAGAVGGKVLANKLEASTNAMFVKVAPFAPLILGIGLPMFIKNATLDKLALGLVATGGLEALGSNGLKVISGMEVIGYPGEGLALPYRPLAAVAGPSGAQGLDAGTHSNFSGSRMSQINTIAGVAGMGCNAV